MKVRDTGNLMLVEMIRGFFWGFGLFMAYTFVKYVMHIHLP